jgi:hypothetical protein
LRAARVDLSKVACSKKIKKGDKLTAPSGFLPPHQSQHAKDAVFGQFLGMKISVDLNGCLNLLPPHRFQSAKKQCLGRLYAESMQFLGHNFAMVLIFKLSLNLLKTGPFRSS